LFLKYTLNYIRFYYHSWVDTSSGGLLVPESIIRPIVSASALTWFITNMYFKTTVEDYLVTNMYFKTTVEDHLVTNMYFKTSVEDHSVTNMYL
jgi:hypothetical protein